MNIAAARMRREKEMALRNVVTEGDPILRKKCREVTAVDDRIRGILDDMLETMRFNNGVGIAAPQVGIMRRMFVAEPEEDKVYFMINPVITLSEGEQEGEEGCLSVPGMVGTVKRPQHIVMEALDRDGKKITVDATDFEAIVLCHEYDHLEGILYTDKCTNLHDVNEEPEESEEQ